MARYQLSDGIRQLLAVSGVEKADKHTIEENGWITHRDIITLYKLSVKNGQDVDLADLMVDAKLYVAPAPKQVKTKEYLNQMKELKAREQELEYQKMVNKDDREKTLRVMIEVEEERRQGQDHNASQMAKEIRSEITVIVNVLVSLISVVYAIWYWSGTSTHMSIESRVLWSLFFGLLVLVAEVVVFGGYLRKIQDARAHERAKSDRHEVVETFTFGSSAAKRRPVKSKSKAL